MKKFILSLILGILFTVSLATAVSNPVNYNGKNYYVVTSTDPTEDSGDEVCGKLGMVCTGFTESTTAVCKQFHSNAASSSSLSGDKSGVYCDGSPQGGVCSTKKNTCHTCPACTVSVGCNQAIGGLYREMYVECQKPAAGNACSISISAKDTNTFINQIPGLNAQLQACPQSLPKGASIALSNGNTVVNINMNNGNTQSLTIIVAGGMITGITKGSGACKQTTTISENDLNNILNSQNGAQAVAFLVSQGKLKMKGCGIISKIKFFFVNPFIKFAAKKQAPQAPPPKPAPNCGQVSEQCNNRGCFSGICAAPKENLNGQWGYWNHRCISQSDWASRCEAHGNVPAPWKCLTGPCS